MRSERPQDLVGADVTPDLEHTQLAWRVRWNLPALDAELTVSDYSSFICVECVDYERGTVLGHADIQR